MKLLHPFLSILSYNFIVSFSIKCQLIDGQYILKTSFELSLADGFKKLDGPEPVNYLRYNDVPNICSV